MKTIIAEGKSPELAFNQALDFTLVDNATKKFNKANQDIDTFAANYLNDTFSNAEGYGAYIILEKPKKNGTPAKYKVENVINKGVRKWITITNFIDSDNDTVFEIPSKLTTKALSIKKAKSLSEELGKTIKIVLTKRVNVGSATTAVITAVPAKEPKGKYYFFGTENITIADE